MRRQKDEVGARQQVAMELQRPAEMQQVRLQTQVTRGARAHVQVLGVWPTPAHSPCSLHQWAWGSGRAAGRRGLSRSGWMCAAGFLGGGL